MSIYLATEHGVIGDDRTCNTRALQILIDRIVSKGGGTLLLPRGSYRSGILRLGSGLTLRLMDGAVLRGTGRLADYRIDGKLAGLLYARAASDLRIEGPGLIDGAGEAFFDHTRPHDFIDYDLSRTRQGRDFIDPATRCANGPVHTFERPGNLMVFAACRNLVLTDFAVRGAAYWTIHLADCEDALIQRLHIDNDRRHPNNDGIHLTTCRRTRILDCVISTGDDAIAVTGFRSLPLEPNTNLGLEDRDGVGEDIEIARCRLASRSSGIRIGYGQNDVRRVSVHDVLIHDSNRGICIQSRNQGALAELSFERIRICTRYENGPWWGHGEAIHLSAADYESGIAPGLIRDVSFRDIDAEGEDGILLWAQRPGMISDVRLERVSMRLCPGDLSPRMGGNRDLRPTLNPASAITAGPLAPLDATRIEGLELKECRWSALPGMPVFANDQPHLDDSGER